MAQPVKQPGKKKKQRNIYPLLVLVTFFVAIGLMIIQYYDNAPLPEKETAQASISTATLTAVGDINISAALVEDALQDDGSYECSSGLFCVTALLHEAGMSVGNLELSFA